MVRSEVNFARCRPQRCAQVRNPVWARGAQALVRGGAKFTPVEKRCRVSRVASSGCEIISLFLVRTMLWSGLRLRGSAADRAIRPDAPRDNQDAAPEFILVTGFKNRPYTPGMSRGSSRRSTSVRYGVPTMNCGAAQ